MSADGAGGKGNGTAAAPIQLGSRKLVQSLKEIVDCPEAEIYAMLRECNMDPNEAVHRLLSQDTFHEVKSKRDKKKEIREPPESRSRSVNINLGRESRGGSDRGGRSSYSQSTLTDYGAGKDKPINKKENGSSIAPVLSVVEFATVPNNPTKRPTIQSTSASMGIPLHATNFADVISTSVQSSTGLQNNWLGKPAHVSMADIVKMGRPQGKHPSMPAIASGKPYISENVATSNGPHHNSKQIPASILPSEAKEKLDSFQESTYISDINHDLGTAENQHISTDGWYICDEQPTESVPNFTDISGASAVYANPSALAAPSMVIAGSDLHIDPCSEDFQDLDERPNDKPQPVEYIPVPERKIDVDTSIDGSHSKSIDAYQSEDVEFDHHEAENGVGISSTATTLMQLSIHEETSTKATELGPAVIIPDHLRVTNADCAHLSFGSFGSGAFSGSFPSKLLARNLEAAPALDDVSIINESDTRNHEYFNNEPHKSSLTENVASISGTASENLDVTSISESEVVRNHPLDAIGPQSEFPSVSSYGLPTSSQPNVTTYTYQQENSHMQNILPLSSLMQSNILQNNILAAASNPHLRDFDLPLSPLRINQSMPTRYGTMGLSIGGPTTSMPEAPKPGMFPDPQSAPPSLPTATTLTNSALPQALPVHHYSQPPLPLGHFANMISYPILPQSYAFLPPLQQTLSPNSLFNQSAAVPSVGMKYSRPQYKGSLSVTSLPQASASPTAYGGFGSSSSIPGGFNLNHTTMSSSTTIRLDEPLNQQYKEASHYLALQQNENPTMWIHGAGSRTMSPLPSSIFYNYPGQDQHGGGFRQAQQPSHLGNLGYSNMYLSQGGASREHQQNSGEVNLNGSQAMPASQIWQHGY
ncbi:uncharacterized protein LOC122031038 [Zingiber officinale]|uniref:uncharacterized protein LOC122031038 n=1 Tax=Zingiber officinale TaxID=94328 RepID=UPI001C4BDA15|nr:uncharacterized protein LOC122031038 [Zingiber officinale]